MLIITIIFIVACSKLVLCDGNYSIRIGRAACTPTVNIVCNTEHCKYRVDFVKNKFVAVVENCKTNEVNIKWRLRYYKEQNENLFVKQTVLTEFDNKKIYVMKPGTVKTGYFGYVYVDVTAKTGGATAQSKAEVWMYPKQYHVEMTYGNRVMICPGSKTTMQVAKRAPGYNVIWLEINCTLREQDGCEEWLSAGGGSGYRSCPTTPSYFMGKNDLKRELPPAHICLDRISYKVSLASYIPVPTSNYFIYIDPNCTGIVMFIRCVKNCAFSSTNHPANPYKSIVAEVVCLQNCDHISKTAKFRVIRDDNVAVTGWKAEGRKLTIFKDGSSFNKRYKVSYREGEHVVAEGWITVSHTIPNMQCEVEPPSSGSPIFTDFVIKCKHGDDKPHYMLRKYTLYKVTDGVGVKQRKIIGTDYVPGFRTTFHSDVETVELKIEGHDMQGVPFGSRVFSVQVKIEPMTKEILKEGFKKMDGLNAVGDHPHALNVGASIALGLNTSQLSDEEKKKAQLQVLKRIANTIGKVDLEELRIIETVLSTFYPVDESNVEYVGRICEAMAKELPDGIGRFGNRDNQQVTSKALLECGNQIFKYEHKRLKGERNKTKAPPEDSPSKEEYPDYETEYGKPVSRDEKRTMKIMKTASIAFGYDNSMGPELRSKGKDNEAPAYVVVRDMPEKLAGKTFDLLDVKVKVSPGISKLTKKSVVFSMLRYPSMDDESSPMVEVGFYTNRNVEKSIRGVTFTLEMPIKKLREEPSEFKCTVPKTEAELHYKMNCHRAKVRDAGMLVQFRDIQKGVKMQVMFTFNRRPEYEEFATKAYIMDGDIQEKYAYSFTSSNKDKFFYACVLPYKENSTNIFGTTSSGSYKLSILFARCNSMNEEGFWEPSECVSTLKLNKTTSIDCKCTHTTLFSGTAKPTASDINKMEDRNFKLEYFINWVVFGHVAAVVFCYCFLLMFISFRRPSSIGKDKLIFLSDNNKNDRYAYILIVESGAALFSGTTSNVCITLYGVHGVSDPHVLNYPDPDNKLLQRHGLDWMVITTMKHLGPLKHIHLWFDSIGCRPQWCCESITVLDLQTRKQQYFNIQKWLSMGTKNPISELHVPPTSRRKVNTNIVVQLRKFVRVYTGPEHTWNIIKSSQDFEFTYPQRLTVILSLILTTYSICFIILSQPEFKLMDEIGYGRFKFGVIILYTPVVAALSAAFINFPAVFFFRNSRHSFDGNSVCKEDQHFSFKVTVVVWIFLLTWIFFVASYLIIFGFWITWNSSMYWIISTIIAILLLVFILENIYIALYNVLCVICGKIRHRHFFYARIIREIENQRKFLYGLFDEHLFRPYFKLHYQMLRGMNYQITKIRETLRFQARLQLFDLLIFLAYIIVMYYLSLCHTLDLGYVANHFLQSLFSICKGVRKEDKYCEERLYTIKNVYDYINQTVLPHTFPLFWYNGNNTESERYDCSKLLGVIRLRQQRREQICDPHRYLEQLGWHCNNESKIFDSWPKKPYTVTAYTLGYLGVYSGEGYVINLGRTLKNSRFVLKRMLNLNWIDVNTEVLFIEFWTYNANYNFFNMVKIIIERDVSGRYILSQSIYTSRLIFTGFVYYCNYIMVCLLVIFVFVITYRCVARWIAEKKGFLLVFWNAFDLTLAALNVVFLFLYFYRLAQIDSLMQNLAESDPTEFIEFHTLEFIAKAGVIVSAIILSMATLRLSSYLHFGFVIFKVAERAVKEFYKSLMYALLFHSVMFIGFAFLYRTLYGSSFRVFSDFSQALMTLIVVSLNKIEERHLDYYDFRLMYAWPYMLWAVFFFLCVIIATLYETIIMNAWSESKMYYSNVMMEYSIKDYVIQETRFLIEKIKRHSANVRLRGGGEITFEDNELVTPKEVCVRYAGMHSLSKLQLRYMQLIAQAVIIKHVNLASNRKMSRKDIEVMAKLVICLYDLKNPATFKDKWRRMDDQKFFCTKDLITHAPVLIEDFRLLQMEIIVKQMLKQIYSGGISISSDKVAERMGRMKSRLEEIRDVTARIQIHILAK